MPSFDIVSEVNKVEVKNAVEQCNKEVTNRFDFKGSDSRVEIQEQGDDTILMVFADDNFRHVRREIYQRLDGTCPKGQMRLHIIEVPS